MSIEIRVHEKGTFSYQDALTSIMRLEEFKKAGAIATFIGIVRGEADEGKIVQKLVLEAYEEKANEVLSRICSDLREKQGIVDVQIHHLVGEFEVGEELVYVLVAGSHRKHIFPVLEEAVERYKKEAPIFKKEFISTEKGNTNAYWIHERNQGKNPVTEGKPI